LPLWGAPKKAAITRNRSGPDKFLVANTRLRRFESDAQPAKRISTQSLDAERINQQSAGNSFAGVVYSTNRETFYDDILAGSGICTDCRPPAMAATEQDMTAIIAQIWPTMRSQDSASRNRRKNTVWRGSRSFAHDD
jgi:hypothetical protein